MDSEMKTPPDSSPKSSPTKKETDTAQAALNHLVQGKRHLLVMDIPSAVNSLQEACSLLAGQYGETGNELGDAYYYYGKALLEMARMETGVIGNALEGVPESEDSDNSQVEDPEKLTEESGKSTGDEESDEGESEEAEDGEKVPEEDIGDKSSEDEAKPGTSTGEESKKEEEIPNLQLAWEVLELAKIIFLRREDTSKQMQTKLSEVYLKLGEVSLESENYAQSIEDLSECLKIQQTNFEHDNRCIAETHYQLGVAYSFAEDFDRSIKHFHSAVKVIEDRIANLKKVIKNKDKQKESDKGKGDENSDPWYTEQGEIDDLLELLPDMREKILDTEATKEEAIRKMKKALIGEDVEMDGVAAPAAAAATTAAAVATASSSSTSSATATKPVSNISHLVRKKRKPEEESAAVANEAKKAKSETLEGTDANATCNGVMCETTKNAASAEEETKNVVDSKKEATSSETAPESET